jgi:hypothetical protein
LSAHRRQRGGVRSVAEAGKSFKRFKRLLRQAVQFADHQVDHVVGVTLGSNAPQVPRPASCSLQRVQELDHEERIAPALLVHELRQ